MNELKPNKLKKILKEGKVALGTCVYSFSPDLVGLAGYCGIDFVRIDNEHAYRQDDALENMIRAAALADTVPIARVDRDNPYLIRKALEIGAGAVLIPQIENAREVQAVVKAAKFPPLGTRGFGNLNASGHYSTIDAKEWIEWSNSETLVGVMIETKTAVAEAEAIMKCDGLDFVLIGAADMSISYGLPKPNPNDPIIQANIKMIAELGRKYKKGVMLGVGKPWVDNAKKYIDMGINMIELGHDITILKDMWQEMVRGLR